MKKQKRNIKQRPSIVYIDQSRKVRINKGPDLKHIQECIIKLNEVRAKALIEKIETNAAYTYYEEEMVKLDNILKDADERIDKLIEGMNNGTNR